jgi:hypothetical protein
MIFTTRKVASMIAADGERGRRKWSLWRAALYGLIVAAIAFTTSNLADGGKHLAVLIHAPAQEAIPYFAGQMLVALAPALFVLVAFLRNRFVKASN